ncbi:hypothetical protein K7X08_005350 [Anisodus acutangulus]|uniref:Transcription factor CBF/NF-Y/archaeal histone domain-containing protein n=1 Tax=Anisodus acutangulus TaxID=402998 RepID=A0A9Q1LV72_9SOLA|nr:hypothetical protein K7X08_005350 [Anisodus acutangulus]
MHGRDSYFMSNATCTEEAEQLASHLQNLHLSVANVTRIMSRNLPQHAKVTDETKESVQKLVSSYIHHITKKANERCKREQRRTVTAEDILWAMNKIGLTNYVGPLILYLHKYREQEAKSSLNTRMPNFELALAPPIAAAPILPINYAPTPAYSYPHFPSNPAAAAMMNGFSLNFRNKMARDDSPTESSSSSSATNYGLRGVKDPYEQFRQ